jgi:hypothetical protein
LHPKLSKRKALGWEKKRKEKIPDILQVIQPVLAVLQSEGKFFFMVKLGW